MSKEIDDAMICAELTGLSASPHPARNQAIADYAIRYGGSEADLDAELESAAVEHLLSIGGT